MSQTMLLHPLLTLQIMTSMGKEVDLTNNVLVLIVRLLSAEMKNVYLKITLTGQSGK